MGATPDQLKADIEQTREELSTDVDALADKVSPTRVAQRRMSAVRSSATSVKDKVMGTASDATSTATGSVSSAASSVTDTVTSAPQQITSKAQGNPLAAGLIAFGAGMVIASLMPETRVEQAAAAQLKDKTEPALDAVKESAASVKDDLAASAKDSAQEVKATAQEAVEATTEQAHRAKESTSR